MATLMVKTGKKQRLKVYRGESNVDRRVDGELVNVGVGSGGCLSQIEPQAAGKSVPPKSKAHDDSSRMEFLLDDIEKISRRRKQQLQRMPPVLEGWEISGAVIGAQYEVFHGGFYDWSMRDDGTLAFAAGCALGRGLTAAFTAASLLAAFRSHVYYHHTVSEMLSRLNQTLWVGSTGDQFADLFYGVVFPHTGRFELGGAGCLELLRMEEKAPHWNTFEANETLGVNPDAAHVERQIDMSFGEQVIVLISNTSIPEQSKETVLKAVDRHRKCEVCDLPEVIERQLTLAQHSTPLAAISLLVVRRCHP